MYSLVAMKESMNRPDSAKCGSKGVALEHRLFRVLLFLLKPKRARPPQSSAAKLWAQASAAATFTRQTLLQLNSLQRQRSASASD